MQVPREHKQNCFTVVDWRHESVRQGPFPIIFYRFWMHYRKSLKKSTVFAKNIYYMNDQVKQVVKVIWQNGCIGSVVFARWGQCAPHQIHPTLGESTTIFYYAQLTDECHMAFPGISFPLKIAPWHKAILTPSNTWFLGLTWVQIPNGISIGSAVFVELKATRPYTLQWAAISLKIAPPHRGSGPHLIYNSLAYPSLQPEWHLDISRFCTAERRVSLYFTMGRPFPPKIVS